MQEPTRGRNIVRGLILSCALLSAGCSVIEEWLTGDEWKSPRVVKVTGVEKICNYPPSWCVTPRGKRPAGVLARDGDLFQLGKDGFFVYRETDGESLVLDKQGDVVFVNAKAVSIALSDKGAGWEWLRKASVEDLAQLRLLTLMFKKGFHDFSLLEKVARVRPDVGLLVGDPFPQDFKIDDPALQEGLDRIARLVSLFEPQFLLLDSSILSARFDVLEPKLKKLKGLVTTDGGPWDFLRRLPRLRTLAIIGSNKKERIPDLSFMKNAAALQELNLWLTKDLTDITALAALPALKKLDMVFVAGTKVADLSVLDRLPELAWLGFPGNTTQEIFDRAIANHPGLEVVQLFSEGVAIRDFSALQRLPGLKGAIILQKNIDVETLHELKNLEYLALHKNAFTGEAAKKTEALEKALPGTFVARAEPFCLGSGWILLLLPLVVLLRSVWPRRQDLGAEVHA